MSDPFGPLRYYHCDERVPETIVEHLRDHQWIFMFQSRDEFAMFLANEIEIPRQEVTRLRSLMRQKDMEITRLRARVDELEGLANKSLEVLECSTPEHPEHWCAHCDDNIGGSHIVALRAALEDKR